MKVNKVIMMLICILLLTTSYTKAAVISDNDGSAFITKAEFEAMKKNFNTQVERYNESIDSKIDGAIASYLAAMTVKMENVDSILNRFSTNQRTFVQAISNPTTCTQDDIYIEESGYWVAAYSYASAGGYSGYALAGLVGFDGGHQKRLWPKNNGKTSKYIFLDTTEINKTEYLYINDNYRKYIQYYIYISGALTADSSPWTEYQHFGGPTSISWTNTYNWSGESRRRVTAEGTEVNCTEVLMLQVNNDDYDTTVSGVNEMAWASRMSGSTIYTTNAGCLKKSDRLNWTHRITNFSLGNSQQQSINAPWWGLGAEINSNNNTASTPPVGPIPLSFNVPKITMLGGDKIIVNDISKTIGEPVYYYSGLPLCTLSNESKNLTLKIKPTINKKSASDTSGITLAIKKSQFNNSAISAEASSDLYYTKTWTATDLPDEIKIELKEEDLAPSRGKTIWVKAIASNTNCTVTLETTGIVEY